MPRSTTRIRFEQSIFASRSNPAECSNTLYDVRTPNWGVRTDPYPKTGAAARDGWNKDTGTVTISGLSAAEGMTDSVGVIKGTLGTKLYIQLVRYQMGLFERQKTYLNKLIDDHIFKHCHNIHVSVIEPYFTVSVHL
jgi:hypothetical protein